MNKCLGCGSILQDKEPDKLGYTSNINSNLCERCFRIKNYGDYKVVNKDNNEFIDILKQIDKTNDIVVLVIDIFSLNQDFQLFKKYLHNDIIVVLTKRDLLPDFYEQKVLDYIDKYELNATYKIMVSSKNNYNFDELYNKLKQYKKAYVVGYTNAGKSTLINKLVYNYGDKSSVITTSILPSTTLDMIEIKLDNLTLIDTPGILENDSILNYVDTKTLKDITPNKKIKPITYQVKGKQIITISNLVKLEVIDNDITIFTSNKLDINRYYDDKKVLENLTLHNIEVDNNSDIVIKGLGFIKVKKKAHIKVYTLKGVSVYIRQSLI